MNQVSTWMVSLLSGLFGLTASAQFSIDWHTIDGGGGASIGNLYSVTGTIGQPDASSPQAGGNFSLTGGFWSLLSVVQTPGAPSLAIALTATNTVIISWPSPSAGFTLQQNMTGFGTTNWNHVVTTPTDNGTIKYIVVDPQGESRIYRLARP